MAFLILRLGGGNSVDYELPSRPLTIGRAPAADLQIADEKISRIHCGIRPEGNAFLIKDLGSTNGTWVNDHRVREATLRFGDSIRLGHTVLAFESEPRQHSTAKLPDVIEIELPNGSFSEAMQRLAEQATRASQHPPISPSGR